MFSQHSIFRRPVPTEPRHPVDIPCRVAGLDGAHAARIANLSGGGLKLVLLEDVSPRLLHGAFEVEIEALGTIRAELRWRKRRVLGCAFRNRIEARRVLCRHFRHRGTHLF